MHATTPAGGDEARGLELFLLALRYREGRLQQLEGNTPLVLDDPQACWVIYTGKIDLFAVQLQAGEPVSPRRHLARCEAGELLFGFAPADEAAGLHVLASGVPGTSALKLRLDRLRELSAELEYQPIVTALIERWVAALSQTLPRVMSPREPQLLAAGEATPLAAGATAAPRSGVLWVKQLEGTSRIADRSDLPPLEGDGALPLAPQTWLRAMGPARLQARDTAAQLAADPEWLDLLAFQRLTLRAVGQALEVDTTIDEARLMVRAELQERIVKAAIAQLASPLNPAAKQAESRPPADLSDPLVASCRLVGAALGVAIGDVPEAAEGRSLEYGLRQIARASYLRVRQVALTGAWWQEDGGPLLASYVAGGQAVALLPTSPRSYALHDPLARGGVPLTAELAARLSPYAHTFYRPFPQRALGLWDVLSFGLRGLRRDLLMVLLMGLAVGLLGVLGPIATGIVFDRAIPQADSAQLLTIGLLLLVIALASALFQVVRSIAMLRIEGRVEGAVQAAIWDRLLSLPVPFFRNYSSGDLGMRAMGVSAIRLAISGPVVTAILGGIFSLFNLLLLFAYDVRLALVAMGLVLLAVAFTSGAGYLQVRHQRALAELQGRIAGTVLQFINGIAKFRVAGAEQRAFATWAEQFSRQRRVTFAARGVGNGVAVFGAAYPLVTSLAIFAAIALTSQSELSTGQFLAFNAAFVQLLGAALQLSAALIALLQVVPLYERAQPILTALPEVGASKADPGELSGAIEVSHASFRYRSDGPLSLADVSIQIQPGEFVALVGPSGSGKSTLLRLLLGFETPTSGSVFYDGQDLTGLELTSVRQQIGVVLQNGKIMTGALLQNIIGSAPLTVDDAWAAARLAGLEEDIKQMPMGMFTMISEGGGTLSGGQRQRLLIARAIASRPRIIFFDEATSALDNRTQELVSQSLGALRATRVVIAHRLSTIIGADRIYVLERGRVVQSGTYSELIAQPGLFADMARRQIG